MEKDLARIKPAVDPAQSVYDAVGGQIATLIRRFGLEAQRDQILAVYQDICHESLDFPPGRPPSGASRINQDGTPIQYALTIGSPLHSLQFISEAGPINRPGFPLSGTERLRANRDCLQIVAERFQVGEALASMIPLLEQLAPANDIDLLVDPGGAFWTGVAFTAVRLPAMRIYTNAAWGKEEDRRRRQRCLASAFGVAEAWGEMERRLSQDLKPLGTAITLSAGEPPSARIYLTTYGKYINYYEALAEAVNGPDARRSLQRFAMRMLADDYVYPTPSAVASFGVGSGEGFDFKFELCAHCLFASDAEAESRLQAWFAEAGMDPADYDSLLDTLSEGPLSRDAVELHAYVGVGSKQGHPYTSVYLKPRLMAATTGARRGGD